MAQAHSDATASTRSIADELHELAEPIRTRLEALELELEAAEQRIGELRTSRTQLRTALRAVDPTFEPATKPGPKGKSKGHGTVGPATVEAIAERLRALNGDAFTASELADRDDWPHSYATTSAAFRELHTRGVIRLDKAGERGLRFYRLV